MANPPPRQQKQHLRSEIRLRLAAARPHDPRPAEAVGRWLAGQPRLLTIAAYAAMPGEVDLAGLLAEQPGRRWVFPRISGHGLIFHRVRNAADDLCPGPWGILEPSPTLPEIPVADIDAFLCPGLAFDPAGGRLGRGRGFYDRLLASARPDALKIGVCHAGQLVPDTFPEAHDIAMDLVISG